MNKEEILYNKIYEQTKEFGRTHFIKEIMKLQRDKEKFEKLAIHRYKYASEMEGKYILEKAKKDQLRSWLENEIIDSKAVSSQYYWFGRVLSKLNELEGGKND